MLLTRRSHVQDLLGPKNVLFILSTTSSSIMLWVQDVFGTYVT